MAKKVNRIKETTRTVERSLVSGVFESIWGLVIAKAPFFDLPIIKQISRFALERVLFWLSGEGIIWFNSVWIRLQVSADFAKLEDARQLAILEIDHGATEEQIAQIDRELVEAFRKAHRIGRGPL